MSGSWSSARSERGMGTWDLAKDATLRIRPGRSGVVLRADRGCLLVTQPGDPEDHVLQAGEEVRLPRGGDVVAWVQIFCSDSSTGASRSRARGSPPPEPSGASACACFASACLRRCSSFGIAARPSCSGGQICSRGASSFGS